jgi:hypothetical protein
MKSRLLRAFPCILLLFGVWNLTPSCLGQAATNSRATAGTTFAPLQQWKNAVNSGNAGALKALYSTTPPAKVSTPAGEIDADADVTFWTGLKVRSLKLDIAQSDSPQPGVQQLVLEAEVHSAAPPGNRTVYISQGQLWQQQGDQWRLVAAKRSEPARLQQPTSTRKNIYPPRGRCSR